MPKQKPLIARIVESLGRSNIARAVNVSEDAVSHAVRRGHFPTSWYAGVRDLALAANVDFPAKLFPMRDANSPIRTRSGPVEASSEAGA